MLQKNLLESDFVNFKLGFKDTRGHDTTPENVLLTRVTERFAYEFRILNQYVDSVLNRSISYLLIALSDFRHFIQKILGTVNELILVASFETSLDTPVVPAFYHVIIKNLKISPP